ncbi:MAG: hypothetical protein JSS96_00465 [Bacteroidetes bacterium]|nr:hypothetical protein [Bacteroidota bacterium]
MFFIPFIRFSVGTTSPANAGKVLYNYAIALLDEAMKNNSAFVEEEDSKRFTSIYTKTFLQSARSIYTAKRHAKTLAEALPILKDKVNICDLITITGIKIFYPKLYDCIKTNGTILAGSLPQATYDQCKQQIHGLGLKLDAIIKEYNEASDNGNFIRGMLILLFPRLNLSYKNISQTDEDYLICVEKRRICSAGHFDLYFSIQYKTL